MQNNSIDFKKRDKYITFTEGMKILYLSPHPHLSIHSPAGYATHMREMIDAFKESGCEVETLIGSDISGFNPVADTSPSMAKKWGKIFLKKFIPHYIIESLKDYRLSRYNKFYCELVEEKIKNFSPDMIYERAYFLMSAGSLLSVKYEIPHIWEVNSPLLEEKEKMSGASIYSRVSEKIEKEIFLNTQLAVFVSQALENYYLKKYPFLREKSLVTPNAINFKRVIVSDSKRNQIKEMYRLKGDEQIVGFVGSIFPYHGVDVLITSFNRLIQQKSSPRKVLMIVGDGETLPILKQQVKQLNIQDSVIFTGNVKHDEVYSYMSLFSVAVMAKSNWYGSPVKIFEYAALKLPILAPNVEPINEVMEHGIDGLIEDSTEESLYRTLCKILADKSLRIKLGNSFHEKVLTNHTWERNAERVLRKLKMWDN